MLAALMERGTQRGTSRVPSRNDSGCCTAAHRTKASARRGTPWRGLGEIVSWELFGFVMPIIVLLR